MKVQLLIAGPWGGGHSVCVDPPPLYILLLPLRALAPLSSLFFHHSPQEHLQNPGSLGRRNFVVLS